MAVIRWLLLLILCGSVAYSQISLPGGISDGRGVGSNTNTNYTTTAIFSALNSVPASVRAVYVDRLVATGAPCPLTYNRGGSTPTGGYGEILVGGVYWEPRFDTAPVKACQFGTVADGVPNQASSAPPTGTDNTAAIQNALDFAMRNNYQTVCLLDGFYKTTDTLAMGWGNNVYTLSLQACNNGRGTYSSINYGVTLLPTKTDRCTINIAGGRYSSVKYIQIIGSNYAFTNTLFSSPPIPTTAAGWLDPTITPTGSNPGGIQRHSPFSAVCVDAYAGSAPSDAYPAQTFPSWTGISTQYNQDASTNTSFENLLLEGFGVCVNNSPNNGGNGDFTKFLNSSCFNSVYGVSIGNSQSRNVTVQNVNCNNIYTLITNTKFGNLAGELGGNIMNVGCGQTYQMFDIGLSIASTTVQDLYMESSARVGSISGGSITFRNCTFSLGDSSTGQVVPAAIEAGNAGSSFTFDDCKFSGSSRISALVHYTGGTGSVIFNGGVVNGGVNVGALFGSAGAAGQNALNYTGGWLMGAFTFPNSTFQNKLTWQGQSLASFMSTATGTTNLSGASWAPYPVIAATSRALWSQAMQGFIDGGAEVKQWQFQRGPGNQTIDMTGALWTTALSSSGCDTWSGQWSASQQTGQNGNLQLGDIFYHQSTGTIWSVESVGVPTPTNYPVTIRQQNNMTVSTSTGACVTNNLGTTMPSGNTFQIHVTAAIPGQVFYCDFAAGSTALSNCSRGDGNGTQIQNVISAGDKFWAGQFNDTSSLWPFLSNATISSATNGSPGSIVLSNNAAKTGRFPILPFPTGVGQGLTLSSPSSKSPTAAGSGGTCATGAVAGGALAGTVTLTGACAAGNTIALTVMPAATAGYACQAMDRTQPATLVQQTATTTTGVTFTVAGTTSGATDVIQFGPCLGY